MKQAHLNNAQAALAKEKGIEKRKKREFKNLSEKMQEKITT